MQYKKVVLHPDENTVGEKPKTIVTALAAIKHDTSMILQVHVALIKLMATSIDTNNNA